MQILGGIVVLQVTESAAHPQPPFTIIYSRLPREERREEREREWRSATSTNKGTQLRNTATRNSRRREHRSFIKASVLGQQEATLL